MKKSAFMTVALAAGLLMTNPFGGSANAQEPQQVVKVYQSNSFNFNQESFQSYIDQYIKELSKRYGIQFNISYQQPTGQQVQAPVKQQPSQQKPVEQPTKPAPAPQQTVQQPTKPAPAPAPKPAQNEQANYSVNQFEQQVVQLTNAERAKYGLAPLKLDSELSKVAREKSSDMARKGYFSHTSPTYGSPFDMMKKFGISYRAAGENIAKGQTTPEQVVNAWMNSEGHRANILNSNYTHIGVGYVSNGNIWTQMFIGK